jgi:hypothetical protein
MSIIIAVIVLACNICNLGCTAPESSNITSTDNTGVGHASVPATGSSGLGSIKATPNLVPTGQGGGMTKISWNTKGDLSPIEVYVSQDSQPETKFAQGTEGSSDAPWIMAGSKYEFRLYAGTGTNRKLIDKIEVTRNQ